MPEVKFFVLSKLYCPVHLGNTWHVVGAEGHRVCLECRLIGDAATPNIIIVRPEQEPDKKGG